MSLFSRVATRFKKTEVDMEALPGLNVCILQRKLERFSSNRLNSAIQAAWHHPHNASSFFGMNLDDEHGLIKAMGMFIPVYYWDRRLDDSDLNGLTIPTWADHTAFCKISFVTGDGLTTTEDRHKFTGVLALLCLELSNDATTSFFFMEDAAFIAKDRLTKQVIFERESFDPRRIASS
jgi:hypothetical protein